MLSSCCRCHGLQHVGDAGYGSRLEQIPILQRNFMAMMLTVAVLVIAEGAGSLAAAADAAMDSDSINASRLSSLLSAGVTLALVGLKIALVSMNPSAHTVHLTACIIAGALVLLRMLGYWAVSAVIEGRSGPIPRGQRLAWA